MSCRWVKQSAQTENYSHDMFEYSKRLKLGTDSDWLLGWFAILIISSVFKVLWKQFGRSRTGILSYVFLDISKRSKQSRRDSVTGQICSDSYRALVRTKRVFLSAVLPVPRGHHELQGPDRCHCRWDIRKGHFNRIINYQVAVIKCKFIYVREGFFLNPEFSGASWTVQMCCFY